MQTRTVSAVVVALTLTLTLAACGGDDATPTDQAAGTDPPTDTGGSPETTTYDSPAALAAAIGCEGYADQALDGPTDPRAAAGTCTLGTSAVTLGLFADAGQQEGYRVAGAAIGCSFAETFGFTELAYAEGELWSASVDLSDDAAADRAALDAIASATGGTVAVVPC